MTFQAPKGVSEYLPPRGALFEEVRDAFAESARRACYADVETAVFEDTALFVRGVGESSDVVRKEMYSFTDRGGREITLRPEFTAGVLRAVLEHNLHKGALPVKVFTSGPAFRYERPQAGRYRQFYQFDLEAIGTEDPVVDAETIAVAWDAYQSLGLQPVHAAAEQPRRQELPPGLPRGAAEVPARARPRRGHPAADRDQPAPRPRRQAPRGPRADAGRAGDDRLPLRRVQGPPRHRARPCWSASASPTPTRPAWSAVSTTTPGPPTSSTTRCSAPSRASAAAAATTGSRRRSAARRCPGSASRSALTV